MSVSVYYWSFDWCHCSCSYHICYITIDNCTTATKVEVSDMYLIGALILLAFNFRSNEQSVLITDHTTSIQNDDVANLGMQSQKQSARDKAMIASDKETNIDMVYCLAYGTVTSTRSTGPTNIGSGIYEAI